MAQITLQSFATLSATKVFAKRHKRHHRHAHAWAMQAATRAKR